MNATVLDRLELDGVTAELRFSDWEIPDHLDTQGYAVPRYTLRVERDGEAETFVGWGSIHEAEEQELTGTAARYLDLATGDALRFYDYGGESPPPERVGVNQLHEDFGGVLDNFSDETGSPAGEAVRVFLACVETARKFHRLGLHRDGLAELHQAALASQ